MTIQTQEEYTEALRRLKLLWMELMRLEVAKESGWRTVPLSSKLDELAAAIDVYEQTRGRQ